MAPYLSELVPAQAAIGDAPFTLYCKGAGFTPTCVIVWNGGVEPTTFLGTDTVTTGIDMSTAVNPAIMPVQIQDGTELSNVLQFVLAAAPAPTCPVTVADLAAELGGQVVASDPRAQEAVDTACALVQADLDWSAWPAQVPAPVKRAIVGVAVDQFRLPSTAFGYLVDDAGIASTGTDSLRRWRAMLDPYRHSWGLA